MKYFILFTTVMTLSSCHLFKNDEVVPKSTSLEQIYQGSYKRIAELPRRRGVKPLSSSKSYDSDLAHVQVSDCDYPQFRQELLRRIAKLGWVKEKGAEFVAPGTRVFALAKDVIKYDPSIFLKGREFIHVHDVKSCSYHLRLRFVDAHLLVEKGWAEYHPKERGVILLYAPRNEEEMEVIWFAMCKSYLAVRGL